MPGRYDHCDRVRFLIMDRVTLAGFGGTLATVSGSFHEVIGIVAGAMTVIYMAVKIWQEIKKK